MKNSILIGSLALLAIVIAGVATMGPATVLLSSPSTDRDQDNVPDTVEAELCDRPVTAKAILAGQVGRCVTAQDWLPPNVAQRTFLPATIVMGPDADRDGLPAYVRLDGMDVAVNPFSANPITLTKTSGKTVSVDEGSSGDDSNRNVPLVSGVKMPIAIPLGYEMMRDGDRDDLPSAVQVKMVYLMLDRSSPLKTIASFDDAADVLVPVDSHDDDASQPVVDVLRVSYVPTRAWHDGDADEDLVPHALTVEYANITVDRRVKVASERVSIATSALKQVLDQDDGARDNVVQWSLIDKDVDFVPDEVEAVFCLLEKKSDPSDGVCDASGKDYGAVAGFENPWSFKPAQ
jgi:hypothetical protein